MMNLPKITVYIPSHNYGKFLEQAIESVMRQSVNNWELLLIDDNSADNTSEVLNLYRGDPRIRLFRTDGIGLIGVANLALNEAQGEYIIRLDGDDYFDENILLVLSHYLDQNPSAALVFPDFYLVDANGGIISLERREKLYQQNHMLDVPANGACTLVRTQILKDAGGYRTDIDAHDGFDLWVKMCRQFKCANINLPLFFYRRHGKNLTEKNYRIFNARRHIKRFMITPEMEQHRPVIALIPCRRNYDFMPDAWSAEIGGKTLLCKSLEIAVASDVFDEIVVACDTEAVREEMMKFSDERISFFLRESEETIRSRSIVDTMERATFIPDPERRGITVLVHNQAPFKTTAGIEEAVYTTLLNNADSAIAVREVKDPIYKRTANGIKAINPENNLNSDFDMLFIETRTILAAMNRNFPRGMLLGNSVVNFVVPDEESFFIKSKRDLQIARAIAELDVDGNNGNQDVLDSLEVEKL
ncbi:glycosyltransferase family 2 protein [Calditrichota bacterium]